MGFEEQYRSRRLTESFWEADTSVPLFQGTLGDALRRAAREAPDRTALVEGRPEGGRRWTYRELLDDSERVAAALLTRFRPGERVAFCADNVPEWVPMLYGCAIAGLVLVTVNPAFRARELKHVLAQSEAVALFTTDTYRGYDWLRAVDSIRGDLPALRDVVRVADFWDFVVGAGSERAFPPVGSRDACVIMFTSGTTGTQKGVMFHHQGVANMAYLTQARGGLTDTGVFISPMPLFYIGGLGHVGVGAVMHRATHVVVSHWDPALFMRLVEREGGTYSLLVPTMIEAILAHPARGDHDLSTLRHLISGASVVEAQLIRRTQAELGATLCNVYGQTEMQGVVTATHRDDLPADQTGTIGQPIPHVDVKIADPETGAVRPIGVEGELWVRGYQLMLGYFGMGDETARAITPDGWLRSGDLATMDERGFVRICGRIKELIIRGGQNIYPREVENLLLEHPDVENVAVVGVPDPYWGEQVGAVILPKSADRPPDVEALHAFARDALAAFKTPSLWYVASEFPFTETGKLQKFKLVEAITAGTLMPEVRAADRERRRA